MTETAPVDGSADPLWLAALGCDPVFIVGCERSGTTLVRLMLDSHPAFAIPDESHFIVELHRRRGSRGAPAQSVERALAHPRFERWGLDPALVRRRVARDPPRSFASAMRVLFAAYAADQGKPRWGDKSPPYTAHIPLLARLFPQARFVHVIRDGREVAASLASQPFWSGTAVGAAAFWKRRVSRARRAGERLGPERYTEVRLERLIADPEAVLRQVCEFLHEPFAPQMLRYHKRASHRVWSGTASEPDRVDHRHLSLPPTPGLRDWRAGLSAAEQRAVQAAAQPLLHELGYCVPEPGRSIVLRMAAYRVPGLWRAGARMTQRLLRGR